MLTLYGYPRSSNALKVRFLLEELGLAYAQELVPVEQPRPAAYLALNPLGKVPTLVDDGITLTESHAILRYLARREGRHDLYGPTPGEAAHVDEWLDRFALVLRPAFFAHESVALHWVAGRGFFPELGDPAAARAVAERIAPTLRLFDGLVTSPAPCTAASRSATARSGPCSTARDTVASISRRIRTSALARHDHGPPRVRRRGTCPLCGPHARLRPMKRLVSFLLGRRDRVGVLVVFIIFARHNGPGDSPRDDNNTKTVPAAIAVPGASAGVHAGV